MYEKFDQCLLTDAEMRRWERVMNSKTYSQEEKEDKLGMMFEGLSWPRSITREYLN